MKKTPADRHAGLLQDPEEYAVKGGADGLCDVGGVFTKTIFDEDVGSVPDPESEAELDRKREEIVDAVAAFLNLVRRYAGKTLSDSQNDVFWLYETGLQSEIYSRIIGALSQIESGLLNAGADRIPNGLATTDHTLRYWGSELVVMLALLLLKGKALSEVKKQLPTEIPAAITPPTF
jgi:hypothetical protein